MPLDLSQLLVIYAVWHYSRGLHDFFSLWENGFRFIVHFFSLSLLLRTFFSPFHRLREMSPRGFHPADYIASMTVNIIMRIVGVLLRGALITAGIVSLFVVALLGTALLVAWVFLPVFVAALFIRGFTYIFF
ncbi:MAG: hypothetical protein G01um101448_55 [Parcubacteria group bacterium Gr01-1014_48]|nr:MAG: hypothetical protein G01um101448_55 [Parcubacteria group bacterium Gr01-1014_48]TSD08446.1 MAG: hypothetical protein Greene07144_76 [Parcubacteria group bacterium Greene0714_4]